jgi:hypothetical protein
MGDTNVRRLAGPVTVGSRTYHPGDDLPPDVVAQIRNPKAWAVDAEEVAAAAAAVKKSGTASGARLATHVTVNGRTWSPDAELPDDVAAQIRNPKAWVGGKVPDLRAALPTGEAPPAPADPGPAETPPPDTDTDTDGENEADGARGTKPRKAGPRRP